MYKRKRILHVSLQLCTREKRSSTFHCSLRQGPKVGINASRRWFTCTVRCESLKTAVIIQRIRVEMKQPLGSGDFEAGQTVPGKNRLQSQRRRCWGMASGCHGEGRTTERDERGRREKRKEIRKGKSREREKERRGEGVRGKVEAWVMREDYYRQMRKREEKGGGLRRRTMRKEVE